MFEFIEKVVYINLDHREDRRQSIEEQLNVFPPDKVLRFPAIKDITGLVGCCKSHIAVLEMAMRNKWRNVLIVEDDAVWNKFEEGYALLEKLAKKPYDVILLGSSLTKFDKDTYKLQNGYTTTAYLVSSQYYEILLHNFKSGLAGLIQTQHEVQYALDKYWVSLQKTDNWYCVIPCLMYQVESWSDITNKVETTLVKTTGEPTFQI